jgi:hypothetical protein
MTRENHVFEDGDMGTNIIRTELWELFPGRSYMRTCRLEIWEKRKELWGSSKRQTSANLANLLIRTIKSEITAIKIEIQLSHLLSYQEGFAF